MSKQQQYMDKESTVASHSVRIPTAESVVTMGWKWPRNGGGPKWSYPPNQSFAFKNPFRSGSFVCHGRGLRSLTAFQQSTVHSVIDLNNYTVTNQKSAGWKYWNTRNQRQLQIW